MWLAQVLRAEEIPFEQIDHDATYTAQRLADVTNCSGHNVIKPVLVKSDRQFALCIVPAFAKVNLSSAAAAMGVAEVRLGSESELADLFPDCEIGAEPPVGKWFGIPTFMDSSLLEDEYVVFQAGTHTNAIKMRRDDFEKLADPVVIPIAENHKD